MAFSERVWNAVAIGALTIDRASLIHASQLAGFSPTKDQVRTHCGTKDKFSHGDFESFLSSLKQEGSNWARDVTIIKEVCGIPEDSISMKALRTILQENGDRMTDAEVDQIFALMDLETSDATITFSELDEQFQGSQAACKRLFNSKHGSNVQQSDETWFTKRMLGWFLVCEGGVSSPRYTFTLTSPSPLVISIANVPIDTTLFLLKADDIDSTNVELVGISETAVKGEVTLKCDGLEAGHYLVLPATTGCMLAPRTSQPKLKKLGDQDSGELELSKAATAALQEIFSRFDASKSGTLSKDEYDVLAMCTDGEKCEDETWQYMTENMEMKNGALTFKGFCQLYTQVLGATEGGDAEFYKNFQSLGYNQQLVRDEAVTYEIGISAPKNGLVTDMAVVGSNMAQVKAVWMLMMRETGSEVPLGASIRAYVDTDRYRSSWMVINEGSQDVTAIGDTSHCRNFLCTQAASPFRVDVDGDTTLILAHVIPKDPDQKFKLNLKVEISHT